MEAGGGGGEGLGSDGRVKLTRVGGEGEAGGEMKLVPGTGGLVEIRPKLCFRFLPPSGPVH